MKTIVKFSVIVVLILLISPELFADVRPSNTVGVPLDGGLLAILAGAGAAYYTARSSKKNKKKSQ